MMWLYVPPQPAKPEPESEPADTEADRVLAWRALQAMALGFEWCDAASIAASDIDLHKLQDLLARGATHSQAYLILA